MYKKELLNMKFYNNLRIAVLTLLLILFNIVSASADDSKAYINIAGDKFPVHTFQKSGNDNENFVLLFLGDGYTINEQDKFIDDIAVRSEAVLRTEPFRSYSDKINIYAVSTVSNESGASQKYGSYKRDTYFGVLYDDVTVSFSKKGESKAYAIKEALETTFLDSGAVVGTIHMVSNFPVRFGSSVSPLYSFSSTSYSGGEAAIHEIAHSVGKLKDETGRIYAGVNATKESSPDKVPWSKLLGFRGVGIEFNGNDPSGNVPTTSCIMKSEYDGKFCEVCKLELAKRMNSHLYTQAPDKYYVANPQITIKDPAGNDYKRIQIINGNLKRVNGNIPEFRTIVQNLTNKEHRIKLTLKIFDANGNNKYYTEEDFTIPPLPYNAFHEFEYEPAKTSISVNLGTVSGIDQYDKVLGEVIDCDTGEVIASDKTEGLARSKINIHHKIKSSDGSLQAMPNTSVTTVYVPKNTVYNVKTLKQLNGYTYVGNNTGSSITADSDSIDIDFYYIKPHTQTTVSAGGNSFTITPCGIFDGNMIVLALYNGNSLSDIKSFICDGNIMSYTTSAKYSETKIFVWNNVNALTPICIPEIL